MQFKTPEIFLIGQTRINNPAVKEWLDFIGCESGTVEKYSGIDTDGYAVNGETDSKMKTDGERLVELAGRRCYLAFEVGMNPNVTKIRTDIADYITNILKQGHGSVLEHVYYNFAIENVSRVFTGEMNRHRAGVAISEGSMRYIRYEDIPLVETPMLTMTAEDLADAQFMTWRDASTDDDISKLKSTATKKAKTREVFEKVCWQIQWGYNELRQIWHDELQPTSNFRDKKHVTSMMRRIIPMGVATGGIWTGNLRALRHVCTMRCSEAAEEEILFVATKILKTMMKEEPILFGDFSMDEKGFWGPKYAKV